METLRYISASLALGVIATWGSENFFWAAPPEYLTVAGWLMTWIAYSLCAAVVLSAVGFTGIGGIRSVFLGGALLGFLVEGVVVDEMYPAFPFQVVWTPLAWHALITAVCIFGIGRVAPHWPLWRQIVWLVALGLFGAVFAVYWPIAWKTLPRGDVVLFYLAGMALVVPLGQIAIDRIGRVPRPPVPVALAIPVLAASVWLAKSAVAPAPERLAFPVMVGGTVWAMWRLGRAGRSRPVSFGPQGPAWRHVLFPLAPLVTVFVAVPVWAHIGNWPGNVPVAAVTVPLSLSFWLWLVWRATRAPARPAV